mgnify:CR=1 FL=1
MTWGAGRADTRHYIMHAITCVPWNGRRRAVTSGNLLLPHLQVATVSRAL